MSGLFGREAAFLLNDGGNDRPGPGRGNVSHRYSGRSRRGGRGRGNFNNRGGGRNSGRSYYDRDVPGDDDGLGNEAPWSGREQRKFAPYRAPNRRPFRGRGYNSRPFNRGGVFDRLGQPTGNGEGSPGGYIGQPAMAAASSWSKVTVHNGAQNSRDWLLKTLSSKIHASLIPVQWHVLGDKTIFFIEDHDTAMKLKQIGNLPSAGGELRVMVKPSPPPMQGRGGGDREQRFTGRPGSGVPRQQQYRPPMPRHNSMEGVASMEQDIDSSNDGVIMQSLSQRYDPDTKGLDLSDMYHDDVLKQNGVQGVMYRPDFANAIMSQIVDKCPDLVSLDLSSNRLRQLDSFSAISNLSSLQILNLSDNQINHMDELNKVGSSSVVNLSLEGNSFVNSCGDLRKYSSLMREKFPNLQTLDGHVLHSPVKFDLPVASSVVLPETKPSYLMNDEVKDFLKSFIEQYYNLYDNEKSREGLLNAYSSEAVFSLSVVTSERLKGPYLGEYIKRSRNIMKVYREKRESLLQHGKLDVVKALNDLPRTKHLPSSFVVDVSQATSSLVVFSLWGLFAEVGHQSPVRAFSRMFVVTSSEGSVSIINDQLTVRNATSSQVQMVRAALGSQLQTTSPAAASVTSPSASAGAVAPQGPSFNSQGATVLTSTMIQQQPLITGLPSLLAQLPVQAEPPLEQKQLLVTQLAGETGMNHQFSEKCLQENSWQYDKAVHAFQCLKDKNALPQEAFIQ